MQIDAKVAKQLIELKYLNTSGVGSADQLTANTDDSSKLFDMMLQQNIGTTAETKGSNINPVSLASVLPSAASVGDVDSSSVTGNTYATSGAGQSDPWYQFDQLAPVDPSTSTTTAKVNTPLPSTGTAGIGGADPSSAIAATGTGASKPTAYNDLISAASNKYGISESLIKAVIDTESSFNPNAGSSAGAKGLMQLMDGTAAGLGVSNSFDPAQNIDGGTKYLSYQIKRYDGNVKTALAAYNAGPGRLQRLGISNDEELMAKLSQLPKETQRYIGKIENAQAKYEL
ncbi:hypothetical protein QE450_002529 [Paenibacillus sp. SORGH_AS306]|uniref:lytic transglycosylase domain-containing protein n=1 Tax=unclassified Paenibacillus TaxID=185978 RepID=UPI002788B46C|nr:MULTISPECIES: lytic transglycosylase domain-containing protein [unclassified Paenibacillus]MDQ1235031.1 hypothetical protein [Paenibacillus sp. SORGH_AS_0306]MDR6112079.1 hypothetical protein [Paenibacillus sp. SORGH_AS_0338]